MKVFSKSKFMIRNSLFMILAFGAILRLYGLNWDQGYHLHPDERMIIMVAENLRPGNLNPKFFAYGSLPLYLLKLAGWLVSLIFGPQWAHYSHLHWVGRILSVIFDLATLLLIFKIGQRVFSEKIGLKAAFLYAICALPVQLSHFYAVDVPLNFFIFLTLYQLILFYEKQSRRRAVWLGISFGLALATKISASVLVSAIGAAFAFDLVLIFLKYWRQQTARWWQKISLVIFRKKTATWRIIKPLLAFGLIVFLTTITVFALTEPYALLDFPTFWQQIQAQHQMTKDAFTFPFTLQYVDTVPYLYHLKNLYLWGMGITLGTMSFLATAWYFLSLYRRVRIKGEEDIEAKEIILVVFFLAYFLVVGRFSVKFMRYLLPLYPLFCLWSAWFWEQLRLPWKKIVQATVSIGTLAWLAAFLAIYSQPNTRVTASQWINQNIPQESKLAVEHWDDRVPLWGNYQFLEMPLYEPDTSLAKWQQIEQNLQEADYLIIASNRLYTPLQKLASCEKYPGHCYPKTSQYYQQLFADQLGFQKVAEFTNCPRLTLGQYSLLFRDDTADESFTVYDHPRVIIFKKLVNFQ